MAEPPEDQPPARTYPTRMEQFRMESGIDLNAWRIEFGASWSTFAEIRSGRDVRTVTLARLVRSARKITGKPVRASDLYDVGDDAPSEPVRQPRKGQDTNRATYDTPLDRFLLRENIGPAVLAREASIARQAFRHIRAGWEHPRISTVRNWWSPSASSPGSRFARPSCSISGRRIEGKAAADEDSLP